MDIAKLTAFLRPHLDQSGVPWALAGGMAVIAWGSSRTTRDLDLVVDERGRKVLTASLVSAGFVLLNDAAGFTNLEHPDRELGRLDLIWLEGPTSERMFEAAGEMTAADGKPVRVVKPEHLIAMKIRAIQSRATRVFIDGPDLLFLLSLPGVDDNEARGYFERPVSWSSTNVSGSAETLELDDLPIASPEVAERLDRVRGGEPMSLPEYSRWLAQFHWTDEQLAAIPLHIGVPRFTLDD